MNVKVCGLTDLNQVADLIKLNIDFFGFIFYEKSPRYVLNKLNLEDIKAIKSNAKVGVFVNEEIDKIIEISDQAELNYIQLHGDENEEYTKKLKYQLNPQIQIIKVIRIGNQSKSELQNEIDNSSPTVNYLLYDTDSSAFGGTGKSFSWQVLNEVNISKPYFLSGGISLDNVENIKLINQKPFALDINSKFETEPGLKNLEKIEKFLDQCDRVSK